MTNVVNMDHPDPESVPVRDAATVMLLRQGGDGLEVCMLQRNLNSDFVGGAYVFPGGAVDPGDGAPEVAALCLGRSDAEASAAIDLPAGGLAFWVAAIRESFEEAGLLMAIDEAGELVSFEDEVVADRFLVHRRAVDNGERPLVEIAVEEHLLLAVDRIHYFSRWITPLGAPRRYDTRFFIAHPPEFQVPVHDDHEVIANLWIRPSDALARHEAGEFELIFPTVRSLEALATFDTAEQIVAHAASIGEVHPVLPTIVDGEHGMRIVLPSDRVDDTDQVYDAATSKRIS